MYLYSVFSNNAYYYTAYMIFPLIVSWVNKISTLCRDMIRCEMSFIIDYGQLLDLLKPN